MLGQFVKRITITLIEVVMVVMLGVACSHPGLPGLNEPETPVPSDSQENNEIPSDIDNNIFEITPPAEDATIYGKVAEQNGTPIKGAAVSDGISVAITDSNGYYSINSPKTKGFVFVSVPGNYIPDFKNNIPQFYQKLTLDRNMLETHNFVLYPANNANYTLIVSADQHLANRVDDLLQLRSTVIPDINSFIASERNKGMEVYSLSLGDISWDQYWTANSFGLPDALKCFEDLDCPTYHTIGNHDNNPYISDDWISSLVFRNNIAPTYYSFNIGAVHYVVLDNVIYNNPGATSSTMGDRSYDRALTEEQLEWLSKDLDALSDKSIPIVITAHVPFYSDPTVSNNQASTKRNMLNMEALETVLALYSDITLLSGHYHRNYTVISPYNPNIKEHNVAALCGSLWWTARPGYTNHHLCTDGSPGGYGILRVNGSDLDYMYKGIGLEETDQFRVYDLNRTIIDESSVTGNKTYKDMVKDYAGSYYSPTKDNSILVNVYNWQQDWKIEIIERGNSLNIQRVRVKDPLHILSYECQRLCNNATPTSTSTLTTQNSSHFFKAKTSAPDTDVIVKVTDHKGRIYSSTVKRPMNFTLTSY